MRKLSSAGIRYLFITPLVFLTGRFDLCAATVQQERVCRAKDEAVREDLRRRRHNLCRERAALSA